MGLVVIVGRIINNNGSVQYNKSIAVRQYNGHYNILQLHFLICIGLIDYINYLNHTVAIQR